MHMGQGYDQVMCHAEAVNTVRGPIKIGWLSQRMWTMLSHWPTVHCQTSMWRLQGYWRAGGRSIPTEAWGNKLARIVIVASRYLLQ